MIPATTCTGQLTTTRGRAVPLSALDEKPQRHRSALTGQRRNDAEATSFQAMLCTFLQLNEKGLTRKARATVDQMMRRIAEVEPHLEPGLTPTYAPVKVRPSGEPRRVGEALEVCTNNVRRAVGAGQANHARTFLRCARSLIGRNLDATA